MSSLDPGIRESLNPTAANAAPSPDPFNTVGAPGTAIYGGYIVENEKDFRNRSLRFHWEFSRWRYGKKSARNEPEGSSILNEDLREEWQIKTRSLGINQADHRQQGGGAPVNRVQILRHQRGTGPVGRSAQPAPRRIRGVASRQTDCG